ncbi:hypothetical protein BSL82_15545 [Tardibacter chloracetimidivorans]|uniref:HTH HARE-type domain-containing protein n=1 Tax=Tardibacter chloracetimidivorans TaxID=1921510 RepID=A0A1L3ZY30_9SPHN|nr:hypothetical protein [Tardibacter chloracetimidivorans]API60520.1 hypothetical protein BSL82_15545 [Tardibacter chloracetimidivorans]
MNDTALENAQQRLAHARQMMETIHRQIEASKASLARVEAEAMMLQQFIATWYELAGIQPPNDVEQREPIEPHEIKSVRPKNPPREKVAEEAVRIIRAHGAPMQRKPLFDALAERGVVIQGKDPEMVLSTMLWRESDQIVRLPPHGYWPKDTPYKPAYYDPDLEEIFGSAAKEPEGRVEATDTDDSDVDLPTH